ncbi:MAG TPA: HAD-IB family phosphatase [Ignavibacteria bacterium]
MKDYKLKIFCDFDGTITKNDVWVNALGKFIEDEEQFSNLCYQFANLQITAKQCLLKELELVKNFDFLKFNKYLDDEKFDEYFLDFLEYCREKSFEIFVLSEGLDYYINYILKKENLDLTVFSNKLTIVSDLNGNILSLGCEFPYSDEHCNWCGTSKRNILMSNTNDLYGDISVFIGDGISDSCIVNYADIIFAKKNLASYCWKNNITYFEFSDFNDVIKKLDKLVSQGKIKQRQFSKSNRKDVLFGG